jgi:hypothetical protein
MAKCLGRYSKNDVEEIGKLMNQGTAIVEKGEFGLLVMLPDGSVEGVANDKKAESIIKNWCKRHLPKDAGYGLCTIEWRNRTV